MTGSVDYSITARYYDRYVRFEDDLDFFVGEGRGVAGPMLELMAGTGRVTVKLVDSGLRPISVDASADMLRILATKLGAGAAELVQADVRALPFRRTFELAVLPFNAFSELVSEADRHAALGSIRESLVPGGRFVCTLHNPAVRLRTVSPEPSELARFADPSGRGEIRVQIESRYDPERGVVTGSQTFVRESGDAVVVPMEFCLPTASWFEAAAGRHGFSVEALYGDYDRSGFDPETSRFMIWRLKKGAARDGTWSASTRSWARRRRPGSSIP